MRYYKEEELDAVLENWNKYWKGDESDSGNYPDITKDDLVSVALAKNVNKTKASFYSDFASKYALHIGDYYESERNLVGAEERNTEDSKRFPMIVVYLDKNGNPDMSVIAEYQSLKANIKDPDLKVVVVNKIDKEKSDKELLDAIAKDYGVTYDADIYGV